MKIWLFRDRGGNLHLQAPVWWSFAFFLYQLNVCDATPVEDVTEPSEESLTTISYNTLDALREEDESAPQQSAARLASQEVGEELISTCVTPTRIKTIQNALSKPDTERHLCALKLLPHFFSKEELAESNTDGSHDKKCLDATKLNSLKILVFSKFPVSANEEKDKAWRFIKGKINSKCRATRKLLLTWLMDFLAAFVDFSRARAIAIVFRNVFTFLVGKFRISIGDNFF